METKIREHRIINRASCIALAADLKDEGLISQTIANAVIDDKLTELELRYTAQLVYAFGYPDIAARVVPSFEAGVVDNLNCGPFTLSVRGIA